MIIANGRDVLRHDFHTHSVKSPCGMHTILEILDIAAQKGAETVNICDHGKATGGKMNFGVITDRKRTPMQVKVSLGAETREIRLLAGIEANILDDGESDLPLTKTGGSRYEFGLISAGFHPQAKKLKQWHDPHANFEALSKFASRYPIDIITHPCKKSFPLPIPDLVRLAKEKQFALEVNNASLALKKTDHNLLQQMIEEALAYDVTLLCNSDGHTWHELFECGAVRAFVEDGMNLVMKEVFPLNFGEWENVCGRFNRIGSRVDENK